MIDIKELKNNLSLDEIEKLLISLGIEHYERGNNILILPTYCHNSFHEEASKKLYYYDNNKTFHCYTECSDSFDIIEFVQRVKINNGEKDFSFMDSLVLIINFFNYHKIDQLNVDKYISRSKDYVAKNKIQLEEYNSNVMEVFQKIPILDWIHEGISQKTLDKYNIKFYNKQNKIIIPHYDINNRLIGIRGRALNEEEVILRGKYAPVKVEQTLYKHPLSLNLYGLNFTKETIKKLKTVIIFEGEKSVMLLDSILGSANFSVATCGSSLNKNQIDILVKECNVSNIILAYDKEYDNINSDKADKYYYKLRSMCDKYKNYCNFSFIYDFDNLLKEKDSPIDRGYGIFQKLMQNKIQVR